MFYMFVEKDKVIHLIFIVLVFIATVLICGCVEQKATNQNTETQYPDIQFTGFDTGHEGKQLIPFAVKVSDNGIVTIRSDNGTAIVSGVCDSR